MHTATVIGATGYTGAQLVGLLAQHPDIALTGLYRSGDRRSGLSYFADHFPRWRGIVNLPVHPFDLKELMAEVPDFVFLCTPTQTSAELAPPLLDSGATVIDLSAAFRLNDPGLYERYYGFVHPSARLLDDAVYGLPELNRETIAEAALIASPGCYPTSATLALRPLIDACAIRDDRVCIIDSTSGISGAGRSPAVGSMFCEVSQRPYNVFKHRHQPEIEKHLGARCVFTPHVGPFDRGILSTMHVDLADGWDEAGLRGVFAETYGHEPFVRILQPDDWPSVGGVVHTNFCDIGFGVDSETGHAIVVSAIDNLLKGAAGQAVQCMNIKLDVAETTGLPGTLEGAATTLTRL